VKSGYASSLGSVESNGDVSAQGSGAIYGNATPGPAKKFTGNFTVSGTTAPAKTSIAVPAYEYTPVGTAKGSYSGSATLTAGTYRYTSFSMKATDALTLQGDVTIYVDGSIELAGQASIKLASGAKLSLNQGSGTLSIAGGGVVNASQKPANLQINTATSSAVKVEGTSAFYGTVLAPDAPFTRDGTADFFGAIVAKSATLVGTGWMHYDSSLAGGGAPTFKVALVRGW